MRSLSATMPRRRELDADYELTIAEHRAFRGLCRLGYELAKVLHKRPLAEQPARELFLELLPKIEVEENGAVFCCQQCWLSARLFARTGAIEFHGFKTTKKRGETADE